MSAEKDDRLELWKQAAVIFEAALSRPASERPRTVRELAGSDAELRASVEALLRHDQLESPIDSSLVVARARVADHASSLPRGAYGAYRLVRQLGEGGMGSVFLGRRDDGGVPEEAAIKLLFSDLAPSRLWRMLHAERSILARLDHPNIARLIDAGTTDRGAPYLVLEYVRGEPVTDYADRRRLGVEERIGLFLALTDAVQYAHRHLIVHRDLKPQNVLVTDDGVVKLLDFGIAKLLAPDSAENQPHTTKRFATPGYASPEQLAGAPVSTASDVYGLGVLLHRLLTGLLPGRPGGADRPPFEPPSAAVTRGDAGSCRDRADRRGLSPSALRRRLRGEIDAIVMHCLTASPEGRYGSAGRLGDDLRRYLAGEPVAAQPSRPLRRWLKATRRHPAVTAVTVALVVALVGLVVQPIRHARALAQERDTANQALHQTESVTLFLSEILSLANPFELDDPTRPPERPVTLREVIDQAAARIDREFDRDPMVTARLLSTLGRAYADLGETAAALPRLRRAAALYRVQAPGSKTLGHVLAGLGFALWDSGETARGRTVLEESVGLLRAHAGEAPGELARTLIDLGVVQREAGDLEIARATLEEAMILGGRIDRGDGLVGALATLELGFLDFREQAYVDAERRLRRALGLLTARLGAHHPHRATALHALGWTRARQGRPEEAEQMLREAHEIRRVSLGETHPETIAGYQQIGSLLYESGDLRGAERIFRRALALESEQPLTDPVHLAIDTNALAVVVWNLDGPEAALPLIRQAVDLARQHLGDRHPRTFTYVLNLGRVLADLGNLAAAEPLIRDALEGRIDLYGPDDTRVGNALAALAAQRFDAGYPEEASALARRAASIAESGHGPDHWRTAEAQALLGCALIRTGDTNHGTPLLQSGLASLRASRGTGARSTRAAERRCPDIVSALERVRPQ